VPLLALACGGQSATNVPTSAPALSTATSAATVASTIAAAPTAPALATASRAAATVTRAATVVPATAIASRSTPPPAAQATASRAATAPATAGAATPRVGGGTPVAAPLGNLPAGWQTYGGNTRVPFAIAYPPGWTVDDSRASEGRVYFYGPGVSEPFEDALWVLIATTGRAEPTANIDLLRDRYFAAELKESHPEAGVDVTRANQFSGLTFASLGATFDVNYQLCYAYIGLGLRGQVPWRFRLNSRYGDYSRNLDNTFGPMIASLNIYNNP